MQRYGGAVAIFLLVSARAPNIAIAIVFLALGGVLVLTVAPFEIGAIRWAGVSLLWWYGGLVVPLVAVLTTVVALARMRSPSPPS